jgi:hypothetical protein
MTTSSFTNQEKRKMASKALLSMKRAFPDKQARYQKDRIARIVDRYEKADVDESSSNVDDFLVENASKHRVQALPLLPHLLPSITGAKITMNSMYFTSRPLRSSNNGNTSRTERLGKQMVLAERALEPLPSSQSIPLRRLSPYRHHIMSPAPTLPVLRPGRPMSPAPTLLRPGHPMSPAPVLWTPVFAAPHLIDACNWLTATSI